VGNGSTGYVVSVITLGRSWRSNKARHEAFMRRSRIEAAVLMGLVIAVLLATCALMVRKLLGY